MSGFVILTQENDAWLLTDGGSWKPLFERSEYSLASASVNKALLLPALSGAMTSVGSIEVILLAHYNFARTWSSFDEAIGTGLLKSSVEDSAWRVERRDEININGLVAFVGRSEARARFEAWGIEYGDGEVGEPFMYEDNVTMHPTPAPDDFAAAGIPLIDGRLNIDFKAFPMIMQAQRFVHGPIGSEFDPPPLGHCVAGYLQETHLFRDGCTTRIRHRWDDRPGEPVTPKAGEVEALRTAIGL